MTLELRAGVIIYKCMNHMNQHSTLFNENYLHGEEGEL